MLLVSVLYLFLVDDPFPMWLIIGGAGVVFIGAGSAIQNHRPPGTSRQRNTHTHAVGVSWSRWFSSEGWLVSGGVFALPSPRCRAPFV